MASWEHCKFCLLVYIHKLYIDKTENIEAYDILQCGCFRFDTVLLRCIPDSFWFDETKVGVMRITQLGIDVLLPWCIFHGIVLDLLCCIDAASSRECSLTSSVKHSIILWTCPLMNIDLEVSIWVLLGVIEDMCKHSVKLLNSQKRSTYVIQYAMKNLWYDVPWAFVWILDYQIFCEFYLTTFIISNLMYSEY